MQADLMFFKNLPNAFCGRIIISISEVGNPYGEIQDRREIQDGSHPIFYGSLRWTALSEGAMIQGTWGSPERS
jgi:hypothetical protein